MDKPLSDKKKDNDVGNDNAQSARPAANPTVTEIGGYKARSGGYLPELSKESWENSKGDLRWDESAGGRAAIRLFSRGFLGSAGFAAGNWYIGRGGGMKGYSPNMKFSEISASNPLQYIAKSVDTVVGKPIKFTARMLGKSEAAAEELVRFRPTRNFAEDGIIKKGRSLGNETVVITFDFFCASVFDALGRDIANILDHNVKHDWKDEKGRIKYPEAAKEAGKSLWRYVSYNGGEDWAVSVPYAFYLRGQRNLINRFSQGFGYDSDRSLNGGSFKVDGKGNVIGNYNAEGMLDLQGRFTAYNIGTLMYREGYNHIASKISGVPSALYGSASEKQDKKQTIGERISEIPKWVARSVIKGVIYMTPAVPFFHVFRTPQSSYKGLFINPENNTVLGYKNGDKYDALHAHEANRLSTDFKRGANGEFPEVNFRMRGENGVGFKTVDDRITTEHATTGKFNAYQQNVGNPLLNSIGRTQDKIRNKFSDFVVDKTGDYYRRDANTFIGSAMSYTPYMYAKGEAARLWDSGKMDAAAERLIDGVVKLNMSETAAGAREIWRTIVNKPFTDIDREAYAMKRIREDESPADNLTREQAYLDAKSDIREDVKQSPLSWRQRLVHGRPTEKFTDGLKEKKPEQQINYAEQEAMRKALSELQPPTNSVH